MVLHMLYLTILYEIKHSIEFTCKEKVYLYMFNLKTYKAIYIVHKKKIIPPSLY